MLLYIISSATPPTQTDAFHDTAIQTLALAIVTFVCTFIQIIVLIVQRDHREISYQTTLDTPLPIVIGDQNLVNIKIWNSGNASISRDDYDKEMEFVFEGRNVLSCGITNQKPTRIVDEEELTTFFTIHPGIPELNKVKLAKFMLNKGESITIQAIVSGHKGEINGWARIKHDGRIKGWNKRVMIRKVYLTILLLFFITFIWAIRSLSIFLSQIPSPLSAPDIVLLILAIYTPVLAILVGIMNSFKMVQVRWK